MKMETPGHSGGWYKGPGQAPCLRHSWAKEGTMSALLGYASHRISRKA